MVSNKTGYVTMYTVCVHTACTNFIVVPYLRKVVLTTRFQLVSLYMYCSLVNSHAYVFFGCICYFLPGCFVLFSVQFAYLPFDNIISRTSIS